MNRINLAFNTIKKFGLICTVKLILKHLGINRIKIFQLFKYPLTNYRFKVIFRNNFWLNFEKGVCELRIIKHFLKIIKTGQTILDVGAWDGTFTLLFSKLVGSKGTVYSFEPDKKAFDNLRSNIIKNKLDNVFIEKKGLSNSVGLSSFYLIKGGGVCQSTMILHKEGYRTKFLNNIKKETIQITTIDKFCEEKNIQPNGIKIDVEGVERLVIEGGIETLKKNKVWVLMEFHGLLMPKYELKTNWNKIVESAKKVIFIDGDTAKYHYGMELKEIPDLNYFHIFLQY